MRAEFKRTEKLTLIGIPSSQRSTMCEYNWLIIAKTISLIIDRRSPTYDTFSYQFQTTTIQNRKCASLMPRSHL